jgi:malate synthase
VNNLEEKFMKTTPEHGFGMPVNQAPLAYELPDDLAEFFLPLHAEFTPRQKELAAKRREVLDNSQQGIRPQFLPAGAAAASDWKIALPIWAEDQRNQMTGPADDAELVVKMLNSGAPGVMIDLEDSMANKWENLQSGYENSRAALRGALKYYDKKREREVGINESGTVLMIRVRGLHLGQANVLPHELVAASVFDVANIAFNIEPEELRHPLTFYIPKSESAEEALFWRDLFQAVEKAKGWEKGFIKCFALVEAHPLAFQMEEFLYNLREHILGLNLGRWDYMASLIHFNLSDERWVLPDRNTIPTDVAFFQNLRELMVNICHRRGALAIGGMTALYPNRQDKELNERALKVLAADKRNEASVGMDGAWTGHPDQNEIAVAQFPSPNQNFVQFVDRPDNPDLRPVPAGIGVKTLDGTRAAIRTVIRYRAGVLAGKGASLLDGYMEDLATDRIYRLMITQRMRHRDSITITDSQGNDVKHTSGLINRLFDEELIKILKDLPAETSETERENYLAARRISEEMILKGQHDPI